MVDNRFPVPGTDARFTSPGVDVRFATLGTDLEQLLNGTDTRFEGLTYGGGGGPPVIIGNSATIVSGTVTWTLNAPADYGQDQLGRAFVVWQPGLTILSRTPGPTTIGADAVSGTMKNPQFNTFGDNNGWDQRVPGYLAGNNQSFPISVAAGDILVGQVHGPTPGNIRDGVSLSYSPLYIVATGWGANAIAPAPIGWTGRGTPMPYYVDCTAIAATLPARSLTGIAKPVLADVLNIVQRNEIGLAFSAAAASADYSAFYTQGAALPATYNYGQYLAQWRGAAGLYLISDGMTMGQKATLLAWMISHGLLYDTRAGAAAPIVPNGGHFQFHHIDVALALNYTGRASKLADMITEVPGNTLGQPFIYTAGQIAQLSPHSSMTQAFVGRRRSIVSVAGNVITLPWTRSGETGDMSQVDLLGMELVRESDGASAVLTVASLSPDANTTSNYAVTIAAQPGSPFVASDVVYFRSRDPVVAGDADWRIVNTDQAINPAYAASYRELNYWTEEVLVPAALGIGHSSWLALQNYTVRANALNTPAPARDFASHHDTANGFEFARDFWNTHAAGILQGPPLFFGFPTISGSPLVGQVLTVVPASVAGTPTVTNAYQWRKNGVDISGQTGTTYTVLVGDTGSTISVRQTATNGLGSANAVSIDTAPVTGAYAPVAVEFQSGENLAQTSGFTANGSKFAIIAVSFYCPATIPSGDRIIALQTAGGTDRVTLAFASSGRLNFAAIDSGGATIAQLLCANSTIVADTWYTALYAIDTTQGSIATRMRGWIRPAGGSWSDLSTGAGIHVATLDGIIDNCGRCRINDAPVQSVYYADLFATLTETLDISSGTQRDKFLPLTDRGTTGAVPTGTAPAVYLSGAVGAWNTNKGTGGGLVLTGTLSTAPSAPT